MSETNYRPNMKCDVCGKLGAFDQTTRFICGPCSVEDAMNWTGPSYPVAVVSVNGAPVGDSTNEVKAVDSDYMLIQSLHGSY